ncbi:ROK family protein [Paenibacillus glycanilyticus]|uniref:ROK family protein n=1 Tax=Paenibacillus glycanilyticus TaxID=126569 RepID=UPI00203EEEB3|nr:ROK family protein [Paenibacillus glycanilyticus]MCM3629712.1 ROK family protein [Paenibacillus glycanilyticus]
MNKTTMIDIGIDLGGTKMLVVLTNESGSVIARSKKPTFPEQGVEDTVARLIEMVEGLLDNVFPYREACRIRSIGVAAAGILEPASGTVVLATNLRWRNVPISSMLEERFRAPVRLLNDANAAALGEWRAGAGVGTKDMVFVTVSTGIGGGIVSGSRLILGASDSAAELGHISIDRSGPLCACGNRGCIEMYAAGHSIARIAREGIAGGLANGEAILKEAGGAAEALTAEHVAAAAIKGDKYAGSVIASAGKALGQGIVSIIHLINPKLVVIGGGVARSGRLLLEPMQKAIQEQGIPGLVGQVTVVPAMLGEDAGGVGAAMWRRYEEECLQLR